MRSPLAVATHKTMREVIDLNTALNPNGLEDPQVPTSTTPFVPPMVLGSTTDGYVPELEIGGTGVAGEYGIRFWAGGAPAYGTWRRCLFGRIPSEWFQLWPSADRHFWRRSNSSTSTAFFRTRSRDLAASWTMTIRPCCLSA